MTENGGNFLPSSYSRPKNTMDNIYIYICVCKISKALDLQFCRKIEKFCWDIPAP